MLHYTQVKKEREGGGDGDFGGGDFGGLREHRHRRVGGGGGYYTTTEQMDGKHKTIDLTSEADGGVGLAADEAAEVAMAVAAVKAAEEADEAAEVAVAVEAITAAEEAEAVALAEEAIKAAEEAEMAEIAHQMRATRLKYRDLRAELRARAVRNGVISLSEGLDDAGLAPLDQTDQDEINM
jgi:hypothetical protein